MVKRSIAMLLLLAGGSALAAQESCLVPAAAAGEISGAKTEPADERMSVVRPCKGRVKTGPVDVTFSTGAGYSQRASVAGGELIEDRLRKVVGSKQLVDIWPSGGILAVIGDLMAGRKARSTGASTFEGGAGVPLAGELLPVPGTRIHLKWHGWDTAAPVKLAQGKWSASVAPQAGVLALPAAQLAAGPLELSQGARRTTLTVVDPKSIPEIQEQLRALDAQSGDAAQRATQRAFLFQENQFQLNALSEFLAGR